MRNHYANAAGVLLVYDLTDGKSFESCRYWWEELQTHCAGEPCVLLVGNKLDLVAESGANLAVPAERARKFAAEHKMLCVQTSAMTHKNTKEAFLMLLSAVAQRADGAAPLPPAQRLRAQLARRRSSIAGRCCR